MAWQPQTHVLPVELHQGNSNSSGKLEGRLWIVWLGLLSISETIALAREWVILWGHSPEVGVDEGELI